MSIGFVGGIEAGSRVPCEKIVQELLEKYYPEINGRELSVWIEAEENPRDVGAQVSKGMGFSLNRGHSIYGVIPETAIKDGYSEKLIKALLAHEFAHIVNGDVDGLTGKLLYALKQSRLTREPVLRWREQRADREAIKRGLGKDLYEAKAYIDSTGRKSPPYYYSTQQLAGLIT